LSAEECTLSEQNHRHREHVVLRGVVNRVRQVPQRKFTVQNSFEDSRGKHVVGLEVEHCPDHHEVVVVNTVKLVSVVNELAGMPSPVLEHEEDPEPSKPPEVAPGHVISDQRGHVCEHQQVSEFRDIQRTLEHQRTNHKGHKVANPVEKLVTEQGPAV